MCSSSFIIKYYFIYSIHFLSINYALKSPQNNRLSKNLQETSIYRVIIMSDNLFYLLICSITKIYLIYWLLGHCQWLKNLKILRYFLRRLACYVIEKELWLDKMRDVQILKLWGLFSIICIPWQHFPKISQLHHMGLSIHNTGSHSSKISEPGFKTDH